MATSRKKSNKTFLKFLTPAVIILLVIVGVLYGIQQKFGNPDRVHNSVRIKPDTVLPDFKLTRLNGEKILLSKIPAKVLMINFWATWCESCIDEMPSIVSLREKYKDKGFEVLGINLDENPESVAPRAMDELGIRFPVFQDPDGRLGEIFDVHAIPLTVIINHNRKILHVRDGGQDWNTSSVFSRLEHWLIE